MIKRKNMLYYTALMFLIGILSGCESRSERDSITQLMESEIKTERVEMDRTDGEEEDSVSSEDRRIEEAEEEVETTVLLEDTSITRPKIPSKGKQISDFVPQNWELFDSVTLDFNQDGISDYVGVLEYSKEDEFDTYNEETLFFPRILFAIASEGESSYRLDFQDVNLIRTREEGGVYGDPYEPLTAEGTSFTTHSFGGSAWKWSEDFTYTYQEGIWYLTASEVTDGYGYYTTTDKIDDFITGTGIRKERSSEFDDMDESLYERDEYDIIYEIALDSPPTLFQASMRWWLSTERVLDWPIESIIVMEGIDLDKDMIRLPDSDTLLGYCDETGMLYTFWIPDTGTGEEGGRKYLAYYQWEEKRLSILAVDEEIEDPVIYKGKVYYCSTISEEIPYYNVGRDIQSMKWTVSVKLYRMDLDGSNRQVVFEYDTPKAEAEILESMDDVWKHYPFLALIYEISGDEMVIEVYRSQQPHPFYRMNLDGSEISLIGSVPKQDGWN